MLTGLVCTCTNCRCTRGWSPALIHEAMRAQMQQTGTLLLKRLQTLVRILDEQSETQKYLYHRIYKTTTFNIGNLTVICLKRFFGKKFLGGLLPSQRKQQSFFSLGCFHYCVRMVCTKFLTQKNFLGKKNFLCQKNFLGRNIQPTWV